LALLTASDSFEEGRISLVCSGLTIELSDLE
jgi:hypothetical protein